MSKYDDAFNEARNRFRSKGVGGLEVPDQNLTRDTETASSTIETDVSKHVMMDESGWVMIGSRAIKTKVADKKSNPLYGIIDAGLDNGAETKTTKKS